MWGQGYPQQQGQRYPPSHHQRQQQQQQQQQQQGMVAPGYMPGPYMMPMYQATPGPSPYLRQEGSQVMSRPVSDQTLGEST